MRFNLNYYMKLNFPLHPLNKWRTLSSEHPRLAKLFFILGASLPVFLYVFKFSLLYRNGIFHGEDWDYFAQAYQAARQTILHYHQFPWWNPWSVGGEPLFANQQFGLFSLPMLLVLIFGTVPGLHYSVGIFFLLGFWGMYTLLKRVGAAGTLLPVLLSYLWVFSSFNVWHIGGGHFTFTMYLVAPWAIWLVLEIYKPWRWLWFGIVVAAMINTAAHYLTIETIMICVIVAVFKIFHEVYVNKITSIKKTFHILRPYLYASLVIFILSAFKLVYALQFSKEYPKVEPLDPPESLSLLFASLLFRHLAVPSQLSVAAPYGWGEYADYFGVLTLGLFGYFVIRSFERIRTLRIHQWLLLGATCLAILLTLGSFSSLSPFTLMHHLPILQQMRVPSRFICWFAFGVILLLAHLPRKPVFYILLTVSCVDVFAANFSILNTPQKPYMQPINMSRQFEQHEFYHTNPALGQIGILNQENLRLLRTTEQNQGEIYGYEPSLNIGEYYYLPGTTRCGLEEGCNFVISGNATVTKWTPNQISLHRTAKGPIKINMNPGKVWTVNNKHIYKYSKILELQNDFVINDPSATINIHFSPTL